MALLDYQVPSWAQSTQDEWQLVEIKNGTEVARHDLTGKPCILLGRAADLVDIELAHESCSRRHARIAFDARGFPWLRDLASTHGTTVNKKKVPPEAIGKVESTSTKTGSRGVVLFPGDLLQFGDSTRLFCLEGAQKFERGAFKALEQKQTSLAQRLQQQQQAPPPVDIKEPKLTLDDNAIPSQHLKAWENLKARKYKLRNIETECERIMAKSDLTAGQEHQLEQNRQKMVMLREEVEQMEEELLKKIYPEETKGLKALFDAAEEEEEVLDHTHGNCRKELSRETEPDTEESLVAKWKSLHSDWNRCRSSVNKAQERLETMQIHLEQVGDAEDRFFAQNDVGLAKDIYEKALAREEEISKSLKLTEKLLRVVNDKIRTNKDTGHIGTEEPASALMPPPPPPPPPLPPSLFQPQPSVSDIFDAPNTMIAHPLSKNRVPPVPAFDSEAEASKQLKHVQKRPRLVGPAKPPPGPKQPGKASETGTIAVLSQLSTEHGKSSSKNKVKPSTPIFDSKKDEWRPPDSQDGSGTTALNKKFAGRY